jgi:iron complex transport system substrate-binding protein
MPRIVSLIASATEIVCALGFEKDLVGRSHECDYPELVRHLPVCTEPKFKVDGSSAEIDRRVREVLQNSLSVYRVHAELLRQLRPDVIVTQSQCEVCAVSERDVVEAVCSWLDHRPRVVSLKPDRLKDVWTDILHVAEALDAPQAGAKLIQRLQARMQDIERRAAMLGSRPTVGCIEWIEPLMASGNWMPQLVEMAGGNNVFGRAGEHAPGLAWDSLLAADPECIVVLPCGFDLARTRQDMPLLEQRPGWDRLRAVQSGKVYVTDGNQYFNRPGPRLVESLEILAEILHPDHFHFEHAGRGWERWPRG